MQVSRHWRLRKQRYNLEGMTQAEHAAAVPAYVNGNGNGNHAHAVMALELEPVKEERVLSGRGTVYSYTTVYNPPAGFEGTAPYVIAIIELDEGVRLTAQLTDLDDEPEIGMPVEMVTRKLRSEGEDGIIIYGYKFRPLLS